jgi:hypothetical protein
MEFSSNIKRQRTANDHAVVGKTRVVRFEEDSETKIVDGGWRRQDMTPQDWKRTWFSKRELHLIKKRNVQIAAWSCMSKDHESGTKRRSSSSSFVDSSKSIVGGQGSREEHRASLYGETCRGLEKWVHPQQRSAAKQWRHWSRKSVILEQQRQRFLGVQDDVQLGRVSAQKSSVARSHATLRGMLDQLEVSRLSLQRQASLDALPIGARISRQVSQPRHQVASSNNSKRQEVLIADRALSPRSSCHKIAIFLSCHN